MIQSGAYESGSPAAKGGVGPSARITIIMRGLLLAICLASSARADASLNGPGLATAPSTRGTVTETHRLTGPFISLAQYCQGRSCAGAATGSRLARQDLPAGIRDVRLQPMRNGYVDLLLAIETERGWFVDEFWGRLIVLRGDRLPPGTARIAGEGGLLTLRFSTEQGNHQPETEPNGKELHLVVCGVGASRAPSCTAHIPYGMIGTHMQGLDFLMRTRVSRDALELREGVGHTFYPDWIGRHPLLFL
jgi:hypothetical protein